MKYSKIILLTTLFYLFLINNHLYGQSDSKEELGNSLVKSILNKDLDHFKALLLPKDVSLKLVESEAPEVIQTEELELLRKQSEAAYDNEFIPQQSDNFWEIVNRNETHKIDWSDLEFMILYKYTSKVEEYIPFLIHTRLHNSDYNHFYFSAVRYNGKWFLEDKMEITKEEKYAPHD